MLPVRDNSALREVLIQVGCHGSRLAVDSRHHMEYLVLAPPVIEDSASRGLIIPLIIQTIRRDPSGSDQIDDPSNVSRPDLSGADQIDVEHQATDLAVRGSNPSRRAKPAGQGLSSKRSLRGHFWQCQSLECRVASRGELEATLKCLSASETERANSPATSAVLPSQDSRARQQVARSP
jgi:hypothetical protein